MATYAIGDIQGCYTALIQLLERLKFNPQKDKLWLVGDLVNRGSQSLEVLRFIKNLGDAAITVLGNHDIHLLAIAYGNTKHLKKQDTLNDILAAPDKDELIDWLRHRPFFHQNKKLGYSMIHAGLAPQWTLKTAKRCARELEAQLQDPKHYQNFIQNLFGEQLETWDKHSQGWLRWRFSLACFTRLRYCSAEGILLMDHKHHPQQTHTVKNCYPWFACPNRKSKGKRIIFGHWSTLGLHQHKKTYALDSGCLWGGQLTAFCLETQKITQINCQASQDPHHF